MRRRLVLGIAGLVALAALPGPAAWTQVAAAAEATTQSIQVQITATGPTGPKGVGVLVANEGGTGVQVLVPGAPAGTTATIQAGTCEAVGPELVGLLGEIGASGQAQATVPIPLSQLADGGHVIALHPGLDLTTVLACGAIPAVEVQVPPLPLPSVGPPAPNQSPAVGEECALVPEWVAVTQQRLDRIRELQDAANKAAAGTDLTAYLDTVAANIGEVRAMIAAMQNETVPALAAATNERFVGALQTGVEAAQLIIEAFSTVSTETYQEAVTKAQAANDALLEVRTQVAELGARCPATTPG